MYGFKDDYSEGMHPNILQALQASNEELHNVYGLDACCQRARELISKELGHDGLDIHFVSTGTQANLIALASMLRPHESVIAASTGHIAVHEAGAIEACGHKINTIETSDGKLTPQHIEKILSEHHDEHMVKPKVVYISNSTELGSIYSKAELVTLFSFCQKNDLYLYLDGARLGYALTSERNDLHWTDFPKYLDAFYIGGTKNGGMFGEAIVLVNPHLKKEFRYILKQKGGLLSKSRFLGIQFIEFFKDQLYLENAKKANRLASQLAVELQKMGYAFLTQPTSNIIFPILPNPLIEMLKQEFDFYIWKKVDSNHSAIRLVTTGATCEKQVQKLLEKISNHTN